VHCHQDLTHKIGLKPVDEAYNVLSRMVTYYEILDSPFLVLETPASYLISHEEAERARDLFSSVTLRGVNLVWEIRARARANPALEPFLGNSKKKKFRWFCRWLFT
jgi:hypothetical protein